jgi:hypothetical protein
MKRLMPIYGSSRAFTSRAQGKEFYNLKTDAMIAQKRVMTYFKVLFCIYLNRLRKSTKTQ